MTKFDGFDLPNTTPVPDIVFDELLIHLTGNELKVLLYIIRRTYGFGKNADAISLSQFRKGIVTREGKQLDRGCGIEHNRTILAALTSLETKGYITSKKQNTKAGDCDTTIYKLHTKNTSKTISQASISRGVVTPRNHLSSVGGVVTSGNDGSYSTSPRVVTSGNTQETVLQETVLQENTFVPTAQTPEPSFVTLARDGGVSQSEEHEETGVSHSQWLSESIQEAEEYAPGGGTPVREPTLTQAPAPQSGRDTQHTTLSGATGQARTDRATEQPTRTSTHHPTETPVAVITPPPITETVQNGKYKKEEVPLLCETAPVHAMLNHFRGWVANTGGEIKNENVVIYELCTLYPLAHFQAFFSYLATNPSETAKWWRERHRKMRVKNLRDLLPEVLSELGLTPKPEEPPSLGMLTLPTPLRSYIPWTPHEEIIPRAAVAR